ncbi:MAG: diaminopimelate decarboxylase [Cyanobacteria bacterium RYN_339]|nr:diaminopimelate decarboxylase [Cyanobacteria bacterium RYN_339]
MPETRVAPNQTLMPVTAERDAAGRLRVGGCDLADLAATYGTPLYVMDEATVRAACKAYVQALAKHYPPGGRVLYASKAHCTMAMMALVASEGLGFDVVSAGELHTALKAGVAAERLVMQGNNKPREELKLGLTSGVGRINVDNLDELALVCALAEELRAEPRILLRVAPGIEAHTHDFIRTGQEDSKFGFDLKSGQLDEAMALLAEHPRVQWLGLQAHIGSQIFEANAFSQTADVMVGLLAELRARHGVVAAELDLGGGLGMMYTATDDPPAIEAAVEATARAVLAACERHGYPTPKLVLEPGRSICGTAGVTLYAVGGRKVVPGVRTYLAVDGGMADNPRPITYGAEYTAALAERVTSGAPEVYTLAGRYCESGDILIKDVVLPSPQVGETVVVFGTGAYNHAMASNYNRCGRPAMVLVGEGKAELVVARESLDDMVRLDRLPERLRKAAREGLPCP